MTGLRQGDVVGRTLAALPTAVCVTTCGYTTREVFATHDRPTNVPLVGSMGMAGPVGLGVALAVPERPVVIVDGDGSFAMNPGCLPMIAASDAWIVHLVLDNGMHESTGGQRTAPIGDPGAIALGAGYRSAWHLDTLSQLDELATAPPEAFPILIHVRCPPRTEKIGGRVDLTPTELVARFRTALRVGGNPAPGPGAPATRG